MTAILILNKKTIEITAKQGIRGLFSQEGQVTEDTLTVIHCYIEDRYEFKRTEEVIKINQKYETAPIPGKEDKLLFTSNNTSGTMTPGGKNVIYFYRNDNFLNRWLVKKDRNIREYVPPEKPEEGEPKTTSEYAAKRIKEIEDRAKDDGIIEVYYEDFMGKNIEDGSETINHYNAIFLAHNFANYESKFYNKKVIVKPSPSNIPKTYNIGLDNTERTLEKGNIVVGTDVDWQNCKFILDDAGHDPDLWKPKDPSDPNEKNPIKLSLWNHLFLVLGDSFFTSSKSNLEYKNANEIKKMGIVLNKNTKKSPELISFIKDLRNHNPEEFFESKSNKTDPVEKEKEEKMLRENNAKSYWTCKCKIKVGKK